MMALVSGTSLYLLSILSEVRIEALQTPQADTCSLVGGKALNLSELSVPLQNGQDSGFVLGTQEGSRHLNRCSVNSE